MREVKSYKNKLKWVENDEWVLCGFGAGLLWQGDNLCFRNCARFRETEEHYACADSMGTMKFGEKVAEKKE